jgi:hypothetical protein
LAATIGILPITFLDTKKIKMAAVTSLLHSLYRTGASQLAAAAAEGEWNWEQTHAASLCVYVIQLPQPAKQHKAA